MVNIWFWGGFTKIKNQMSSGWWFEPLWKIWVGQLGWLFPIYGKIKNVPTNQKSPWFISLHRLTIRPINACLAPSHLMNPLQWEPCPRRPVVSGTVGHHTIDAVVVKYLGMPAMAWSKPANLLFTTKMTWWLLRMTWGFLAAKKTGFNEIWWRLMVSKWRSTSPVGKTPMEHLGNL